MFIDQNKEIFRYEWTITEPPNNFDKSTFRRLEEYEPTNNTGWTLNFSKSLPKDECKRKFISSL